MSTTEKMIADHYNTACSVALHELERRARQAMNKDPRLLKFVNAMGASFLVTEDYVSVEDNFDEYPAAKPTMDLIYEWDQYLKLSGVPMRFTADGPVERDW